jgi:hypothetical protein
MILVYEMSTLEPRAVTLHLKDGEVVEGQLLFNDRADTVLRLECDDGYFESHDYEDIKHAFVHDDPDFFSKRWEGEDSPSVA